MSQVDNAALMQSSLMQPNSFVSNLSHQQSCFHCGEPVLTIGEYTVVFEDKTYDCCCPACAMAASTIIDAGLGAYYHTRSAPAARAPGDLPKSDLFDLPEARAAYVLNAQGDLCEANFYVAGMRCGACVWLIEHKIKQLPGVAQAQLNYATERLFVAWHSAQISPSKIIEGLAAIGYQGQPLQSDTLKTTLDHRTWLKRLSVATMGLMQTMMYAWPEYTAEAGTLDHQTAQMMRLAGLVLTAPVVTYSAQPFFAGAWQNLKQKQLGMDVPVVLGILFAFFGSVYHTFGPAGGVYYDSISMFVFLLLGARYLEYIAKTRAAQKLLKLHTVVPQVATKLMPTGDSQQVAASSIEVGDSILLAPGETLMLDGNIIEGNSEIDTALLTGENTPKKVSVGDALPAGAINLTHPLQLTVTAIFSNSTAAKITHWIERAASNKPFLAQLADKIARYFVAGLLLFALCVFVYYVEQKSFEYAMQIAVAVMVVSCPCALSLATPLALASAHARLVKQGIVLTKPDALETLAKVTDVVFDKTGTLTYGELSLVHIELSAKQTELDVLTLAAQLAQQSPHPISRGLVREFGLRYGSLPPLFSTCQYEAGKGIVYHDEMSGDVYALASAAWLDELRIEYLSFHAVTTPSVFLVKNQNILARFVFQDQLRQDAETTVTSLRRQGIVSHIFSGDQTDAVTLLANHLHIQDARGQLLPDEKLQALTELQQQQKIVLMMGDGINDAPSLRGAHLSLAMNHGTSLTQKAADGVLLSDRLSCLLDALQIAKKTRRIIIQNLFWAMLYNVIAIPAAALGWISPWMAAVGMALSSLVVIVNAMRLS